MISYQDKLFQLIEKAITSHNSHLTKRKIEMVTRFDYANTGSFYAQPEGSLEVILKGSFDIQVRYASFNLEARSTNPLEISLDYPKGSPEFTTMEHWILRVIKVWVQGEMRNNG